MVDGIQECPYPAAFSAFFAFFAARFSFSDFCAVFFSDDRFLSCDLDMGFSRVQVEILPVYTKPEAIPGTSVEVSRSHGGRNTQSQRLAEPALRTVPRSFVMPYTPHGRYGG